MSESAPDLLPTTRVLDLFRALEDVQDMTGARVVLLVDAEGQSVAVSGDESELPAPLRAVLGGTRLREAGSVRALLSPIGEELAGSQLNVTVLDVDGSHVLAIGFDADADLGTVQAVGQEARTLLAELLTAN